MTVNTKRDTVSVMNSFFLYGCLTSILTPRRNTIKIAGLRDEI